VQSASKPWWQQATALVSLGAGGAITGFSFVPRPAAELKSPSSLPIHLVALERSGQQAAATDDTLRSAIVNVANYYLRMAEGKTPTEMQAIIWQQDSIDGADHGASCAAFASLTLALGAQAVGRESWVTGGTTYPWPLHKWADVRVNPNPASPGITSIVQDAQAHDRWHGLGDGYAPQPGDWAVFDGHVEVVTRYADGNLHTIGADSLPDFSVNAHDYAQPLDAHAVVGFVDNGALPGPVSRQQQGGGQAAGGRRPGQAANQPMMAIPGTEAVADASRSHGRAPGGAAIPGMSAPARGHAKLWHAARRQSLHRPDGLSHSRRPPAAGRSGQRADAGGRWAEVPGQTAPAERGAADAGRAANATAAADTAVIPGLPIMAHRLSAGPKEPAAGPSAGDHSPPPNAASGTGAEQAFIHEIAPGAVASQRRYGVPASVTIAQAILESGWGQSQLATKDHNLFGIKGTGPAGSDPLPTLEYQGGQQATQASAFRVYSNATQSIEDHGKHLATSPYYRTTMAERRDPDAFAAALTGVYATDPDYGAKLISLMKRYDLYRYDVPASRSASGDAAAQAPSPGSRSPQPPPGTPRASATPTSPEPASPTPARSASTSPAPVPSASTPSAQMSPEPAPSPATSQAPPAGAPTSRPPTAPEPLASAPAPQASTPRPAPSARSPRAPTAQAAVIPGLPESAASPAARPPRTRPARAAAPRPRGPSRQEQGAPLAVPSTQTVSAKRVAAPAGTRARRTPSGAGRRSAKKYQQLMPASVLNAFTTKARVPLMRAEPLYRDVADYGGISWQLLAACDWMQCEARPRRSPVHGEKLGAANPDGTRYRTKSAALERCVDDLMQLADAVYGIDLTAPGHLSVRDLAKVFAAFRWGGLLKLHHTSAMEFPYSVAGLTEQHLKMHWPAIDEPNTPDKPGGRFRLPFGAVPVVLSLNYPATV
jgi:flagellum-specific peptidoglycan hydrolase FlgJ